jgi:hypothetical protein
MKDSWLRLPVCGARLRNLSPEAPFQIGRLAGIPAFFHDAEEKSIYGVAVRITFRYNLGQSGGW